MTLTRTPRCMWYGGKLALKGGMSHQGLNIQISLRSTWQWDYAAIKHLRDAKYGHYILSKDSQGSPPSFHVAGVAQSHIHGRFAWQAWHSWRFHTHHLSHTYTYIHTYIHTYMHACPRHAWQPQGCCACVGEAVVCRASSLHCFVRKVKNMPIEDLHLTLAPNPRVLLGSCAPSSAVSVAGGWGHLADWI